MSFINLLLLLFPSLLSSNFHDIMWNSMQSQCNILNFHNLNTITNGKLKDNFKQLLRLYKKLLWHVITNFILEHYLKKFEDFFANVIGHASRGALKIKMLLNIIESIPNILQYINFFSRQLSHNQCLVL
jgi:hypothetical protein